MKRQRGRGGRGGKPGGGGGGGHHHNQPNRTLESNGPEIKVRGPASHIYERYLQLARDASSSGDRVMAENYLQHAEHYFRVLRAMQPATPPPQQQQQHQNGGDRFGGPEQDFEGDEEAAPSDANGAAAAQPAEANGENADQPDVDFNAEGGPQGGQRDEQRWQGEGGEFRRGRRGRRNRFRPEGERGGDRADREPRDSERGESAEASGEREGGGDRPERREGRPPRRERQAEGDQNGGAEGFSNGPRPAFLRTGGGE